MARLNRRHAIKAQLETLGAGGPSGSEFGAPVDVRLVPIGVGEQAVTDRDGQAVTATGAYLVAPDELPEVVAAFALWSRLTVDGIPRQIAKVIPRTSHGRLVALAV